MERFFKYSFQFCFILFAVSCSMQKQGGQYEYDDVYFTSKDSDEPIVLTKVNPKTSPQLENPFENKANLTQHDSISTQESDEYWDESYTARLNRFDNALKGSSYYDSYYRNDSNISLNNYSYPNYQTFPNQTSFYHSPYYQPMYGSYYSNLYMISGNYYSSGLFTFYHFPTYSTPYVTYVKKEYNTQKQRTPSQSSVGKYGFYRTSGSVNSQKVIRSSSRASRYKKPENTHYRANFSNTKVQKQAVRSSRSSWAPTRTSQQSARRFNFDQAPSFNLPTSGNSSTKSVHQQSYSQPSFKQASQQQPTFNVPTSAPSPRSTGVRSGSRSNRR